MAKFAINDSVTLTVERRDGAVMIRPLGSHGTIWGLGGVLAGTQVYTVYFDGPPAACAHIVETDLIASVEPAILSSARNPGKFARRGPAR